ncbi:MAG: C4-dicarboxylate ABC transporter permease [Lawsonibacter sp.]|jgi:putative tricarboxylic transport membrane protein|nr:C4-dicarboxylate ABC transporter permease [Lawsonibacter sp.]
METILRTLQTGMTVFAHPSMILYTACGLLFGMYAGALPGISATMAISLMVSFTYNWDMYPALAVAIGCYVGAVYGGSRSAILLNVPGTPAAIATAFDGYPLAQQGKAAKALGITAIQSVIGGVIGGIFLIVAAPLITQFALLFAPRDYFLLAFMGILLLCSMSGGSFTKGIFSGLLGMVIGCIGMDPSTATQRFTFGNIYLMSGISSVAIIIGMFGLSESLCQMRDFRSVEVRKQDVSRIIPSFQDAFGYLRITIESSLIGVFIGALPGTGGNIAALLSYDRAKKSCKNPSVPFGEGAIEGLVASESSNNAAVGGAVIPMLTLGIPGDSATALLLACLSAHGVIAGPLLIEDSSGIFGMIVMLVLIANIVLLPVSLTGIKTFAKIVEVPKQILLPIIIVLTVVGSYAARKNMMDVYFMVGFGILGYFLKIHGFKTGPLVLGLILSQLLEQNLRRAMAAAHLSPAEFFGQIFTSPLSIVLAVVTLLVFASQFGLIERIKNARR